MKTKRQNSKVLEYYPGKIIHMTNGSLCWQSLKNSKMNTWIVLLTATKQVYG